MLIEPLDLDHPDRCLQRRADRRPRHDGHRAAGDARGCRGRRAASCWSSGSTSGSTAAPTGTCERGRAPTWTARQDGQFQPTVCDELHGVTERGQDRRRQRRPRRGRGGHHRRARQVRRPCVRRPVPALLPGRHPPAGQQGRGRQVPVAKYSASRPSRSPRSGTCPTTC